MKKIIAICSSASFYKQVLQVEKELRELGFKVYVPITAKRMQRRKDFTVAHYKTWHKNEAEYKRKTQLMKGHFRKVVTADAILVLNYKKNGIPGYIGGNTLMEMTLAFHYKKPIFIYNGISDDLGFKEEIYGMNPIFIQRDLLLIKL